LSLQAYETDLVQQIGLRRRRLQGPKIAAAGR